MFEIPSILRMRPNTLSTASRLSVRSSATMSQRPLVVCRAHTAGSPRSARSTSSVRLPSTATVINARFCKPLDAETILGAARRCGSVVTVEDGVAKGGFGSAVLELLSEAGVTLPTTVIGLPDHFIEHGPVPVLRELAGLTAEETARKALAQLPHRPTANGALYEKLPVGVR